MYGYAALTIALGFALLGDYALWQRSEACNTKLASATALAVAESARRDAESDAAGSDMLAYLAAAMPKTEATTNAAVERVRKIYVDRPIAGVCVRPAGVLPELQAARNRIAAKG